MGRAERRRQERIDRKRGEARARAGEVVGVEQGHVWRSAGDMFEAGKFKDLPAKVPGRHRWIATATYSLSEKAVAGAYDPGELKFLDQENLAFVLIGCWDCEKALGEVAADSACPAPASD